MSHHLLVTNDFPPKVGGIQSYLWELWRRLPAGSFTVYTTPYKGAKDFDAQQPFEIIRSREPVLLPYPWLARRIDDVARGVGAEFAMLDPAVPLGMVGPRLARPYGVVVHGAEVTVPGRVAPLRAGLAPVLRGARLVVAAGEYAAAEATRAAGQPLPVVNVPPGVDTERFTPLDPAARVAARREFGLPADRPVCAAISRLVPRKGFDTVLRAAARARARIPGLIVVIAGAGRDMARLERIARELGVDARFAGRVPDAKLPALYGCADVFAMLCRIRWGGLEQEGFGIVFVEAAAAGVAQIAGASGGASEAVVDGTTGYVIDPPDDAGAAAAAMIALLSDDGARAAMARASRERAVREFSYDVLAARLGAALGNIR